MKVIDLLNKIANREDVPEKIRYDEKIWKLNPLNETYDNGECCLFEDYIDKNYVITDVLNDEIEIIEEDKKIEKIDLSEWVEITYQEDWQMLTKDFNRNCNLFVNKINEIIDKIQE